VTCPIHKTLKRPDRCRECAREESEGRATEPAPTPRILRVEDVDRGALEQRHDHRGRVSFRFKGQPIQPE